MVTGDGKDLTRGLVEAGERVTPDAVQLLHSTLLRPSRHHDTLYCFSFLRKKISSVWHDKSIVATSPFHPGGGPSGFHW
ncbi:hypothetical protein GQ602_001262 [Ophiocordyceps camponoti-floridani]|uniref:Uncharacterized protein n=1 Tax=Ophiocordyceps camponoti-floridani TaxID=2030778 RepID=A0A8H4VH21_9HYPO|nr:hypothetical protein GQ602_001262 [Ophiocordyceps camponoti-floridani]